MAKLTSRLGHIVSEVKDFVGDRLSFAPMRATLANAIDIVFPPHGFNADRDVHRPYLQGGMEATQWTGIRFLGQEGCDMCARPFNGGLHFGAGALCKACVDKPFPFRRTRAACLYTEASKDIILGFKHADRLDLAPMLTRWLERAGAEVMAEADLIIPVPLHPSRLRQRRYNQAAELARPLARRMHCRFEPDALRRIQATKQQGHASAQSRWDNVRKAFAVAPSATKRIADKHIVLIDDVFTTGATLRACAATLLNAGARQVDTVVIARAVPQPEL